VRDYKLELLLLDQSPCNRLSGLETEAIKSVASAFAGNVDRIDSLARMPAGLFFWGTMLGHHYAVAHNQILTSNFDSSVTVSEDDAQAIDRLVQSMTAESITQVNADPSLESTIWFEGNRNIKRLERYLENVLPLAIEAVLSGIVVGAWTAVESLAGDLWEEAINLCPRGLSELKGTKNRINKMSRGYEPDSDPGVQEESRQQNLAKSVSIARIHEFTRGTCNLEKRMGSLLRGRQDFQSLRKIRTAYAVAFLDDAHPEQIDAALCREALDGLSITRNVIAHGAGIADKEYEEKSNRASILPTLTAGKKLDLDAMLVKGIVDPAIEACVELIVAVDKMVSRGAST